MTTSIRPGTGRGVRWLRAASASLRLQEQLWDRYLTAAGTSGGEARAAMGEPPLRWSGRRLRGSVLPADPPR